MVDLDDLRRRIISGGTYTREELKDAIAQKRTERVEAATKTVAKRKTASGVSDAELDEDLKSLGLDL